MPEQREDMPEVDVEAGGRFLLSVRGQAGQRQNDLVKASGDRIDVQTLGQLERGQKSKPTLQQIVTLAYVYGLPVETILEAYGVPTGQETDPKIVALGELVTELSEEHQGIVLNTASQLARDLKTTE